MTNEKAAKLLAAAAGRKARAHRHMEQAQRLAAKASEDLIAVCKTIEAEVPEDRHNTVMALAQQIAGAAR